MCLMWSHHDANVRVSGWALARAGESCHVRGSNSRGFAPLDGLICGRYLSHMPRKTPTEIPLYVRLPATAGEKLDRASEALGIPKKDLVAGLVDRYVDPTSARGLHALGSISAGRKVTVELPDEGPAMGSYSFQPYDPPEVMKIGRAHV